jgi:hypothetical protein
LALTAPRTVRSTGGAANADNWGLDARVEFVFPGTRHTEDTFTLHWSDGNARPPMALRAQIGNRNFSDQGSIYIGENGVLYCPYSQPLVLFPTEQFANYRIPEQEGQNHYLQFVEAVRGNGRTSTSFDYSGPLTETVLLGTLSTRFPNQLLTWDAANLRITDKEAASRLIRRQPRRGWEVEGL